MDISGLKIVEIIKNVKYPDSNIDYTLIDLGLIKDIFIEGKNITFSLNWPNKKSINDPQIKDEIEKHIIKPLIQYGIQTHIKNIIMKDEELKLFNLIINKL